MAMKKLIMTRRRDDPGSAVSALAMTGLVGVLLLASATCVLAQVPRNGPSGAARTISQPRQA
jgi:hypothetical protein